MKRNLFGGLAVAAALTLWTGVAGFAAQTPQETAASEATALINGPTGCETKALATLTGYKTTSLKDPEANADLQEMLADAWADVQGIGADGTADISGALADYNEELSEAASENETAPSLDAFKKEVSDIATDTCGKITRLMTDVSAGFAELTAANSKDEKDDQMKAADDRHADGDKGEPEHGAELERD